MRFTKEEILKDVLKNKRVSDSIMEAGLNKAQIYDALPIFIDMASQKEDEEYYVSFYVARNGKVKRTEILSDKGKKMAFRTNIETLKIFPIEFDDSKEYIKDSERKVLVSEFAKFMDKTQPSKGLYIYGPMGVGKSFTSKRFVKKLAENGYKVGYVSLPELVGKVKSTFGGSENEKYINLQETLKNVDYLFIDDIGAEAITTWFRDEFLFSILNARMERDLVTFFTSNYTYDDLAKVESRTANQKYRDFDKANRLLTRIKTLTKPIILNGINRRY